MHTILMNGLKSCMVAATLLVMSVCAARAGVCDRCGCSACVRRVCVPKSTEKEITKVCWDYKCEEICIPGRSTKCGVKYGEDECGCWSYVVWQPTCARVKTRRVPVKTEVKRKVPSVEWIVEYRCEACCDAACTDGPNTVPPSQPEGSVPNAGQR